MQVLESITLLKKRKERNLDYGTVVACTSKDTFPYLYEKLAEKRKKVFLFVMKVFRPTMEQKSFLNWRRVCNTIRIDAGNAINAGNINYHKKMTLFCNTQ